MPDREKVVKAIEDCVFHKHDCADCEYDGCVFQHGDCRRDLLADALDLLKERGNLMSDGQEFEKAEKNEYTCHYQTEYGERNYKVEDVREWIGSYVAYDKPPETEAKKAKMISNAVASIMKIAEKLVENGTHIDWNTTTIIVKEGIDVFSRSPDWYKNEPAPPGWRMTVGIKIKADPLKQQG